jgi:hypothetical protein
MAAANKAADEHAFKAHDWRAEEDENGVVTLYRDGQVHMLMHRKTWDQLNQVLGTNHETHRATEGRR